MLCALSVSSFFRWSENSDGVASEGCTETMTSLARWAMRATTTRTTDQQLLPKVGLEAFVMHKSGEHAGCDWAVAGGCTYQPLQQS